MTNIFSKEPLIHGLQYSEEAGYRAYFGEAPGERTYVELTKEELAQTHEDLPELSEFLSKRYRRGGENAHIPSASFEAILRQWACPAPILKDINGMDMRVTGIYSCLLTDDKQYLTVHGSYYETEDWWPSSQLQPVPVVLNRGSKTFNVRASYLDEHFPGWEQRYNESKALDLPPEMFVEHMFRTQTSTLHASLTDISFD